MEPGAVYKYDASAKVGCPGACCCFSSDAPSTFSDDSRKVLLRGGSSAEANAMRREWAAPGRQTLINGSYYLALTRFGPT